MYAIVFPGSLSLNTELCFLFIMDSVFHLRQKLKVLSGLESPCVNPACPSPLSTVWGPPPQQALLEYPRFRHTSINRAFVSDSEGRCWWGKGDYQINIEREFINHGKTDTIFLSFFKLKVTVALFDLSSLCYVCYKTAYTELTY